MWVQSLSMLRLIKLLEIVRWEANISWGRGSKIESHICVGRRPRERRPVRLLVLQVKFHVGDVGEGLEITRSLGTLVQVHSVLYLRPFFWPLLAVLLFLHRSSVCSQSQRIPFVLTTEKPVLPLSPAALTCLSPGNFSIPCHHPSVHLRRLTLLSQALYK
jgi:hypothetical protein